MIQQLANTWAFSHKTLILIVPQKNIDGLAAIGNHNRAFVVGAFRAAYILIEFAAGNGCNTGLFKGRVK
jgi:hypothetical protein